VIEQAGFRGPRDGECMRHMKKATKFWSENLKKKKAAWEI